ncbi:transposase [Paenibacillus tarimensis]|uniref:transposase n=1 Tax=Paenibacillus tarimensis TaxID=416012 RepID=UPI001F32307A|nr:transposase [Paenibacillus tarimensis]MCF2943409.1 transposase [Paenibacillus tarimensis]
MNKVQKDNQDMLPMSGEMVEVDGVYLNEAGREEHLHRGQHFPSDVTLGPTEWKLVEYAFDNHHDGRTDPRLVAKNETEDKKGFIATPKQFVEGTDH